MVRSKNTKFLLSILFFMIFVIKDAHAYIDPGSGSYALQILIASLCSVLLMMKNLRQKVKDFFNYFLSKIKGNKKKQQ